MFFVLLLFFLFSSGFFSGSETALVSLPKFRIKKLIQEKPYLTRFFNNWLTSPQNLFSTILIGNIFVNTAFSSIATFRALDTFKMLDSRIVETIVWLGGTLIILIFGEITPKIFSRQHPERFSSLAIRPLYLASVVFSPLIKITNWFTQNLFLIKPEITPSPFLSREEVLTLVRNIPKDNVKDTETSQMMQKVFELRNLTVKDIMTSWEKVDLVDLHLPEEEFIDRVVETGRTRVLIYRREPNKLVGYLHSKDLLKYSVEEQKGTRKQFPLEDMLRPIYYVNPDKKVSELLTEFKKGFVHLAIVKDELDNLLGLVTIEDTLEEIVGEIADEYEIERGAAK